MENDYCRATNLGHIQRGSTSPQINALLLSKLTNAEKYDQILCKPPKTLNPKFCFATPLLQIHHGSLLSMT